MEFLNLFLPIVLYILAIVLIVILIIIGIRFLAILDTIDRIADDIEEKVSSLDGAIAIINKTVNGIADFKDSVVYNLTSRVSKIFKRKKKEDNYYE